MDTDLFNEFLPEYSYRNHLISTLTKIEGRGLILVKNIQPIRDTNPERTSNTLMHELGHAHGEMGDEYRTDDDRDVSRYADLNVNTTTESTVSLVKWNHHIENPLSVLGRDIKFVITPVMEQYDRDADEYVDGLDCHCLIMSGMLKVILFVKIQGSGAKVGMFEGNYYGF